MPPVHEHNKSDEENTDGVENNAEYERGDVQLLGVA